MQNRHHGMNQRIADALERRIDADSVITVDGAAIVHIPFGLYDRKAEIVSSDGINLDIAGRHWSIQSIEAYDPDTGDFVVADGDVRHTVAVRRLPKAA